MLSTDIALILQVYMLDKRMLDPRRPIGKPSQDDQLEQLIPYQQDLPVVPLLYATHSRQVAKLSVKTHSPLCECCFGSFTQA